MALPSTQQASPPQPSTAQPSAPQPSAPQPSAPQPSAPQPATAQPSAPQPSTPQLSTPQPSRPPPVESLDRPALHLIEPDTAVTVGKPLTLHARLTDPRGAVVAVRFLFDGRAEPEVPRGPPGDRTEFTGVTTPRQAGRISIVAEGRDASGSVVARDILWLRAASPYAESVQVHASPLWGDLIPKESLLHQHPIVSVHSLAPRSESPGDDRFGPNRRPAHVIFLVDGKGFGERLPGILETLASIGTPANGVLRERDEIGQIVIGDTAEVRRDFRDGSLRQAIASLEEMGGAGAGSIDLGLLLRSLVSAAPDAASTVGIIVTNGVRWGTYWRRKALPGTEDAGYLLTLDDIQKIRASAWERDISFSTIALSTPEYPLAMDEKGRMSFEPLERKVSEALSRDAGVTGKASAEHAATFNVYIRQMFDLLATLSAATGAERGVRLSRETPAALRDSVAGILQPIVGRFQRRDFEVFEAAPGAKCETAGQGQILEGASARSRDKLLLAIAVDRSYSTNLAGAAHEIQTALRGILGSLRRDDCLLLYSFSARDAERVSNCIDSAEKIDLASGQIVSGASRSQGTDIFGSAFWVASNMQTLEVYAGGQGSPLDPGQELDKALIILTDGWQTVDTMDVGSVVAYMRKHRIRVFEVMIDGADALGRQVAGWSKDTGGALLPPGGAPLPVGKARSTISQLITSVYWGMRDVYRIDYTSSSPEKEWRDVCVRIKDRPDLFVLRESGDGYRADKSAYAHLFRTIEDPQSSLALRTQAVEVVGDLGTEFELRRLAAVAGGKETALRAPALAASLRMSARLRSPAGRLEEIYEKMETPARLEVVKALEGTGGFDQDAVERLFVKELRRPPEETSEELRWEAIVALGRLPEGLAGETLQTLGIFALAPGTPASLRDAARKLLESARARSGPDAG